MIIEFVIFIGTLFLIYHYRAFGYWKRKGIPHIRGKIIFGNVLELITGRKSISEILNDIYKQTNDGMIGFYYFYNPALLVKDPQLIKSVLIKDFSSFADSGFDITFENDPLFALNPFSMKSIERWKATRGIHTPMHSTLKLKEMLPQMYSVANLLTAYLEDNTSKPLNAREVCSCFTIDNVALCAFGTEPSSFTSSEENGFRKNAGVNLFNSSLAANYATILAFFTPFSFIHKMLPIRLISTKTENFFLYMVKKTLDFRRSQNTFRKDFFDHLMKLKEKRKAENLPEMSDLAMAAHCMTLYMDGTETSGTVLCFALLELANHPGIQEELRAEIASSGDKPAHFTLDKINSLNFLDMFLNEVLRIHPPVPFLSRTCVGLVKLGETIIEPGTKVFIPTSALHMDPGLFPKPTEFRPERFSKENSSSLVSGSYSPFGDGPRICLGMKFAQTQVKLALVTILLKYKVVTCSGRSEPVTYEKTTFINLPKSNSKLIFEKL